MRRALVIIFTVLVSACGVSHRDQDASAGAVIGGTGGALIGEQSGSPIGGAIIGAGAGAVVGAAVGESQDRAEANQDKGREVIDRQKKRIEQQRNEIEDIERQKRYDQRFQQEYSPQPLMQQPNSN